MYYNFGDFTETELDFQCLLRRCMKFAVDDLFLERQQDCLVIAAEAEEGFGTL